MSDSFQTDLIKSALFTSLTALAASFVMADTPRLEEIVVNADFRQSPEMHYPASVSVVDSVRIRERAAQYLDEILNVAPNVNFAAGASRGRFIQIRGIGERSQFVDPVNPSVGLMIDGINLSGLGNAGTLYDIEQVEVLRGPQGTRFGANALAGMVNITSRAPTEEFEGRVDVGAGNYQSWQVGSVISGPISDKVLGRLAVQQYNSDGFIDNGYLSSDNTNNLDEFTGRARLRWLASDEFTVDYSLLYVNVNNGYDAFSLDNNRVTLSDQPGSDDQETWAGSVTFNWRATDDFNLITSVSLDDTHTKYSYDEDWTNTSICEGLDCDSAIWGFDWWYSSTDNYLRDHDSIQVDVRMVSTENGRLAGADWVFGIYYYDQREHLTRYFFDWDQYTQSKFKSRYSTERKAAYGELTFPLFESFKLILGGRIEDFSADYNDSRAVKASPDETPWGGDMTLEYHLDNSTMMYGLVSRGFKAGGVNGEALGRADQNNFDQSVLDFLTDRLEFKTEKAVNAELGVKGSYIDDRWLLRVAAFYMKRDDVQLKGWYNEGPLFVGYIDNGANGKNYGLELETTFAATDRLNFFGSLGLLETEIDDFYILEGDTLVDKSGRDQAHAPNYQYDAGVNLGLLDYLTLTVETEGKGSFYFSDSHDQKSGSYNLLHASLSLRVEAATVTFWGRNLTDENYAVRGFYFANDPRDFYSENHTYVQYGEPRMFGVNATYSF